MSQNVYLKIISHIVTDNEESITTANKVYTNLDNFIKHVYGKEDAECGDDLWTSFSHTTENGIDRIDATFSEEVSGMPERVVDDILSVIDTLNNGSYGMLLGDCEYGVLTYMSYGVAEFASVSENEVKDYIWGTDGCLVLETNIEANKLAQLLNCDVNDVCEEAEERGDEIAKKLLPDFFEDMYKESNIELSKRFPHYFRIDSTFSDRADADESDGIVSLDLYFTLHNQTTNQLSVMKKAFDDAILSEWTLKLIDSFPKEGVYTNIMIDHINNSVVRFTTSAGHFENIQFMRLSTETE